MEIVQSYFSVWNLELLFSNIDHVFPFLPNIKQVYHIFTENIDAVLSLYTKAT
jgi:hypothetical protein